MKLMGNRYSNNWDDILHSLTDTTLDGNTLLLLWSAFQAAIHLIWGERNELHHVEPPTDPALIARYIDKHIENRISTLCVGKLTRNMKKQCNFGLHMR